MAGAVTALAGRAGPRTRFEDRIATRDQGWVKTLVLTVSLTFFVLFILLPLILVFVEAFRKGWDTYIAALVDPDAVSAIKLTLLAAAIAVPLNLIFGVAAAWAIARFEFRGKQFLITLIDLPFSVSPVVAGLIYVLVFGAHGWFGSWLQDNDIKIIFAVPGIVLGHDLRDVSIRGARTHPFDAVAGPRRRRSRDHTRCLRPASVLARHAAEHQMGVAVWRHPLQRPRNGRVRRGVSGLRPHSR